MYLSVGIIFDLILMALFLFAVMRGWHMGFAYQAARLAALAASGIVAYALAAAVGIPFLAGLFFIIAMALFLQVMRLVKIVDKIPVLGALDRAGGAVAGFFAAFVIFCVFFYILDIAVPEEVWNGWGLTRAEVDGTYLLKVFLKRD